MCQLKDRWRLLFCVILVPMNLAFTDFFIKNDVLGQSKAKVNKIHAQTKPTEELAELEVAELPPYIAYHFDQNAEDPFLIKSFVREIGKDLSASDMESCVDGDCGDGPPAPHAPYFLEGYNMDQLAMVGTLDDSNNGKVALVKTPDAGVISSAVGEYIGKNNGLILSISKEKMIIREKYRSPQGWKDRMATLNLIRN